jgi:hypothetical protein
MLFLPCLAPLALEVWRPTPEELRELPGPLGLSLGSWPAVVAIEGVVLGSLMWLFQTKTMTVVVTEDGVIMYRIWKLRWHEVTSARLQRSFGLEYLRVVRRGRLQPSLWLPLYFVGAGPLSAALRDHAPVGNPIRECLDAQPTDVQ